MASNLCCVPDERSLSPDTPSARLLTTPLHRRTPNRKPSTFSKLRAIDKVDLIELRRIFAQASLPDDHPDAVKLPHRKVEVSDGIIRSPSFGNKIKGQFRSKPLAQSRSMHNLKSSGSRLFRRKSKSVLRRPTLDELLNDSTSATGGYDSDANSVRVNSDLFASEDSGQPLPKTRVALPTIAASLEWLVPFLDE